MRKLTFTIGLVTGYVLGARAGRERYEQIAKVVRGIKARPAVIEARSKARSKAKGMISAGVGAVTARVGRGAGGAGGEDDAVIDGTA